MAALLSGVTANQIAIIVVVVAACFYLFECLFGYKLIRLSCSIIGFLIGFFLGHYVFTKLIPVKEVYAIVLAVIIGIICGFLATKLVAVGMFIVAFFFALDIALLMPLPQVNPWNVVKLVLCLIISIVCGVLAVIYKKVILILLTAIGGALNCIKEVVKISEVYNNNQLLYWLSIVVLACVGLLIQILITRKNK